MIFLYVFAALVALAVVLAMATVVTVVVLKESRATLVALVGKPTPPGAVQDPVLDQFYDQNAEAVVLPPWEEWGKNDAPS